MPNKIRPNSPYELLPSLKPLLILLFTLSLTLTALIIIYNNRNGNVEKGNVEEIAGPEETTTLTKTVVPSPTVTPTLTFTPTPTHTLVPTRTPVTPTLTFTPTSIHTLVPIHTQVTSTSTYTPTPTATIPITGEVITDYGILRVREQPGTCHNIVGYLPSGAKIIIVRRTPAGDWLHIEMPDGQMGYVSEQFVKVPDDSINDFEVIDLEPENCTPTPTPTPTPDLPITIVVGGDSASGRLASNQEREYRFRAGEEANKFTLIFTPNVANVQFIIYPESEPENKIGGGSRPADDLDDDSNTGELKWDGAMLTPSTHYRLNIVNNSAEDIDYCLVPKDVDSSNCQ